MNICIYLLRSRQYAYIHDRPPILSRDTTNLEKLMVLAYNLKLEDTPFLDKHQIPIPPQPVIPFKADRDTIERIEKRLLFDSVFH